MNTHPGRRALGLPRAAAVRACGAVLQLLRAGGRCPGRCSACSTLHQPVRADHLARVLRRPRELLHPRLARAARGGAADAGRASRVVAALQPRRRDDLPDVALHDAEVLPEQQRDLPRAAAALRADGAARRGATSSCSSTSASSSATTGSTGCRWRSTASTSTPARSTEHVARQVLLAARGARRRRRCTKARVPGSYAPAEALATDMCGIAGCLRRAAIATPCRRCSAALHHRGPDDQHIVSGERFALGAAPPQHHRRRGRPAAADQRGRHGRRRAERRALQLSGCCVRRCSTRGHRLHTHTDTEVLPHLWEDHGERLPEHIDGMFAVAVWDSRAAGGTAGARPDGQEAALLLGARRRAVLRVRAEGAAGDSGLRAPARTSKRCTTTSATSTFRIR